MNRNTKLSLLAFVLSTTGSIAYASDHMNHDSTSVTQAKTTLAQAVATAERQANGKAIKAEYEHSKNKGNYFDIEVLNGDKATDVKVDADKGSVIKTSDEMADREDAKHQQQAKLSLTQAIAAAEQHTSGKAAKAQLDDNETGLLYEVEVVSKGGVFEVKVDADRGTILSSVADKDGE